jgi:hypothetical protein
MDSLKRYIGLRPISTGSQVKYYLDSLPEISFTKVTESADGQRFDADGLFQEALDFCAPMVAEDVLATQPIHKKILDGGFTGIYPIDDLEYENHTGLVGQRLRLAHRLRGHAQIFIDRVVVYCNTTVTTDITVRDLTGDTTYSVNLTPGKTSVDIQQLCSGDEAYVLIDGSVVSLLKDSYVDYEWNVTQVHGTDITEDSTNGNAYGLDVHFQTVCSETSVLEGTSEALARAMLYRVAIYVLESALHNHDKFSMWTTFGKDDIQIALLKYDGGPSLEGGTTKGLYQKEIEKVIEKTKHVIAQSPCFECGEGWDYVIA